MKDQLNKLAEIQAANPPRNNQQSILDKANLILSEMKLENMSYSKILKTIGCSYYCGVNQSAKLEKGHKLLYRTLGLYLAPSKKAGIDVCGFACRACRLACLDGSGHKLIEDLCGKNTIAVSRIKKTWIAVFFPKIAEKLIKHEIEREQRKAEFSEYNLAIRLNCTSDLDWSHIIEQFPFEIFYDYTKNPTRQNGKRLNYHVTYSFADMSQNRLLWYFQHIKEGVNLAIPVIEQDVERVLLEIENTFSMDTTDLRFLDEPKASFGILKAKRTMHTIEGIKGGFILDFEGVQKLIRELNQLPAFRVHKNEFGNRDRYQETTLAA